MILREMLLASAALFASIAITTAASAEPRADERALPSGEASWYGPGLHGRRTASGEVFDSNAMTAAHRSLPFGTLVKVTNHRTGRSTVVRINDRGPYARGRIIDLSRASAEAIGITGVSTVSLARL